MGCLAACPLGRKPQHRDQTKPGGSAWFVRPCPKKLGRRKANILDILTYGHNPSITLLGSSLTLLQGTGRYVEKYLLERPGQVAASMPSGWMFFSLPFWNLSSRFLENAGGSGFVDGRNQVAQGARAVMAKPHSGSQRRPGPGGRAAWGAWTPWQRAVTPLRQRAPADLTMPLPFFCPQILGRPKHPHSAT